MRIRQVCYTELIVKHKLKIVLAPILVVATFMGFAFYLHNNPRVVNQLSEVPPTVALSLIGLYVGFLLSLMGVLVGSLAMFGRSINKQENFYVTAYSSIVNFFGPGQSGPAVRAAYLKLKHGVSVKQYGLATLIYYGFYALISGVIIAVAILPWWLSSIATLLATALCLFVISIIRSRKKVEERGNFAPIGIIAGFALLQIIIQAIIYYIELHSIGSSASVGQILIYTGAANFALFVALTPGAIGFREAFLLFTQRLHDIPNDTIIAANVLDRAAYVAFLLILFIIILLLRISNRFATLQKSITKSESKI
jgi:uncharacterized membrane protein YbhN (UPF0104 family)